MPPNLRVLPDANYLAQVAADHFVELAKRAIFYQGGFGAALSGGSTPKTLY